METLTYQHRQHRPENWLYEIKQKGKPQTCYVMVQNVNDLVKSHLMFAVREEVEVLKEKIAELMDRINQLEVENTILKANASQETLSQLTTATVASPQATIQTSPAQQQSSPALSKINIDVSVLQAANAVASPSSQTSQQPSAIPPPSQNPTATS